MARKRGQTPFLRHPPAAPPARPIGYTVTCSARTRACRTATPARSRRWHRKCMRSDAMPLLRLAPLLCAPLLFAQSGVTVEGTVLNRVTHQGISGVSVTLDRGTAGLAYRAVTDSSGAFRIAGVDPGDYLPVYEKRGLSVADASSS